MAPKIVNANFMVPKIVSYMVPKIVLEIFCYIVDRI